MNKSKIKNRINQKHVELEKLVNKPLEENRDYTPEDLQAIADVKAAIAQLVNVSAELPDAPADDASADVDAVDESASQRRVSNPLTTRSIYDGNGNGNAPAVHTKKHEYSLLRAARCYMNHEPLRGVEGEISQELTTRNGKAPKGFMYMPLRLSEFRDLNLTSGVGGIFNQFNGDYIEFLYNKTLGKELGIKWMTNMDGNFSIPRTSAISSGYWVSTDGGTVGASNMVIDQVSFTPKTVGGQTVITRSLMLQSSIDADKLAQEDLLTSVAVTLDASIFQGTGMNGQPLGILNDPAVPSASAISANGGDPSYAKVVELETIVNKNNASVDNRKYVMTPELVGKCKVTPKFAGTDSHTIIENDLCNGYDYLFSNQLPNNGTKGAGTNLSSAVFGSWSDYVVAQFGSGLDVIMNPYSLDASGSLRITALMSVDHHSRHPKSFAKCVEFTTV